MSALLVSDVVTGYVTNCDVRLWSCTCVKPQNLMAVQLSRLSAPRLTLSLCLFMYGNV